MVPHPIKNILFTLQHCYVTLLNLYYQKIDFLFMLCSPLLLYTIIHIQTATMKSYYNKCACDGLSTHCFIRTEDLVVDYM